MRKSMLPAPLAFAASGALLAAATFTTSAETAVLAPAPKAAAPAVAGASETVTLAGGCFWGVQGVFQHVDGVERAVSGYAGGAAAHPTYEQVSTGTTGYAESVQVTFDPRKVSLGDILRIYVSVAHDPTQIDAQGPDQGTQYRSEIFAADPAQAAFARAYLARTRRRESFRQADRHQGRDRGGVLSGRGLSPELRDPAPERALYRLQRPAEDREPEAAVPFAISR